MDDIWIISWFNHTAFDANHNWKSPTYGILTKKVGEGGKLGLTFDRNSNLPFHSFHLKWLRQGKKERASRLKAPD